MSDVVWPDVDVVIQHGDGEHRLALSDIPETTQRGSGFHWLSLTPTILVARDRFEGTPRVALRHASSGILHTNSVLLEGPPYPTLPCYEKHCDVFATFSPRTPQPAHVLSTTVCATCMHTATFHYEYVTAHKNAMPWGGCLSCRQCKGLVYHPPASPDTPRICSTCQHEHARHFTYLSGDKAGCWDCATEAFLYRNGEPARCRQFTEPSATPTPYRIPRSS